VAEGIRAEGGSDTRRRQGGYGGEEEPDIGEGRQKEAEIERGKGRERERERKRERETARPSERAAARRVWSVLR
jgi:hypothetical protein